MRKAMIQIPQKRFEELIKLEERVNVAVETAMNEEYASVTDILFILGTELAYDNTRYLSLGDFSIQGMNNSDIRDIAEKYHARRCGMCELLQQALKAEENNGTCDFCRFHGPLSQLPYYSEKKYYCSACHYNKPKENINGN